MGGSAMWIIPEAPSPGGTTVQGTRKATEGGLRLGVLDNSKSNANYLLDMIVDTVKQQVPVASLVSLRKPSPAAAADPGVLDRLAEEADCVITAMAD